MTGGRKWARPIGRGTADGARGRGAGARADAQGDGAQNAREPERDAEGRVGDLGGQAREGNRAGTSERAAAANAQVREAGAQGRILRAVWERMDELTDEECEAILYHWPLWARREQLPPDGQWRIWLCLAGRGWGKTRTGAEYIRARIQAGARRIALVGRTMDDVRDVMIEGESGLLSILPPGERPRYIESRRRLEWRDGAVALCFSAVQPDQLRGPQFDTAWADELASWQHPQGWDTLLMGLRLGGDPRVVATTTPRPTRLIRGLVNDPRVAVTRGRTAENERNLPGVFLQEMEARYGGTRLGRQELEGQILTDSPGALFLRERIEAGRVRCAPELIRVVVAIDPAAGSGPGSDETGIVAAGVGASGEYYVLADRSGRYSPDGWARAAIALYEEMRADRIVAEVNNGGEMVEAVLRASGRDAAYRALRASRGKAARAEPVAALYERGKVRHVGVFDELEDQMVSWEPGSGMKSPDRLDALVWAVTELMTGPRGVRAFIKKPAGW